MNIDDLESRIRSHDCKIATLNTAINELQANLSDALELKNQIDNGECPDAHIYRPNISVPGLKSPSLALHRPMSSNEEYKEKYRKKARSQIAVFETINKNIITELQSQKKEQLSSLQQVQDTLAKLLLSDSKAKLKHKKIKAKHDLKLALEKEITKRKELEVEIALLEEKAATANNERTETLFNASLSDTAPDVKN